MLLLYINCLLWSHPHIGRHNLTLMFNAIETRDRLEEDAVEHGNDVPPESEHIDEKVAHM